MNIVKWLEENGIEHLWWKTNGYSVTEILHFWTKDGLYCEIEKLSDRVNEQWCYVVSVKKSEYTDYVVKSMFVKNLNGLA